MSALKLDIQEMLSYEDYVIYSGERHKVALQHLSFEKSLISDCAEFTHYGYCYVCELHVNFLVDFQYSCQADGVLTPNWRERLVCPGCHLNNRMRAVMHIFNQECHPNKLSNIYITEQATDLYKIIKQKFSNVYGSEYLGGSISSGCYNSEGIRNEDLTRTSFDNNQFDYILSFDVFEHIPNYRKALAECFRCLKPGGILLFSVPFVRTAENNIVRACLSQNGEIIHLLPPEYHGDPINPDGCLCFYHFGWDILGDLKAVGFENAKALLYWSKDFGYLGGEQLLFFATKASYEKA